MDELGKIVERLEKVTSKLEGLEVGAKVPRSSPGTAAAGPGTGAGAPRVSVSSGSTSGLDSVGAYQKVLDDNLKIIEDAASKLGKQGVIWSTENQEGVKDVTGILAKAFQAEKIVVEAMSQCRTPSQPELQKLVQPVVDLMGQAAGKAQGRKSDISNHASVIAEAMNALGWIVVSGEGSEKPPMHITQSWQSAEFYANKILKEFRVADTSHVKWVNSIKTLLLALGAYCKEFHLGKPTWKEKGITVSEFLGADPPVEAAPPPPSPPPEEKKAPKTPKPEFPDTAPKGLPKVHPTRSWQPVEAQKSSELAAGVFSGVKQGLRKVSDEQKTKNQPSRTGLVPAKLKPVDGSQVKAGKTELVMERKWSIEGHKGMKDIEIEVNPRQTVYIYKCDDCVIKVNGKVNAITVDLCKRTGILFGYATAAVEIVNSNKIDLQCTDKVLTLAIDKTDECNVYIPKDSMDLEITTAKSSAINVCVTGDDDIEDSQIPDQYVSKFEEGVLVTKPSKHAGA